MTGEPIELKKDALIIRLEDLVGAPLGEHLMMLSITNGTYFDLNPTARLIWETLQTPHTFADLCKVILSEYDVSESQCEQSVRRFVLQLLNNKMVEIK